MSYLGDESRRYGHVPPAQYPVANQQQQDQSPGDGTRRPGFNNGGDSTAYFDQNTASYQQHHQAYAQGHGGRTEEELFMTSPSTSQPQSNYGSPNLAMSGYQHQYQAPPTPTHNTYNPQNFVRTQSTNLPYHPAQRYASPTSPTYPAAPPPATNYTPATYNPAAYANTNTVPSRQASAAGNNSYYNYNYNNYGSPTATQAPNAYGQSTSPTYGVPQATQVPAPAATSAHAQSIPSPHYAQPTTTASPYETSYQTTSYGGQYIYGTHASNGATSPSATTPAYSTPSTQAPYPSYSQIPVGPNSADPNAFVSRTSRSNSQTSQVSSHSPHPQLSPGLQRHPTNAPLPSRPIESVPEEPDWGANGRDDDVSGEQYTQESLMNDIVSDLGGSGETRRPQGLYGNVSDDDLDRLRRFDSSASTVHSRTEAGVNRYASNASTVNRNSVPTTYDLDEDDSDPEGAAGLLAMQEDMDDRRFSGLTFPSYMGAPVAQQARQSQARTNLSPPPEEQVSTDSDFGATDIGLFAGGYPGNLQYGGDVSSPPATETTFPGGGRPLPYPDASVDYAGTGGLQAPQPHRLSFDEGNERMSLRSQQSGSDSPYKEDYPDMFYHPGLSNRPLPALPPAPGSDSSSMLSAQSPTPYQHGYSHSAEARLTQQQQVERSISLSTHSNTPAVQAPARSRTDAAEERRRALKHMAHQQLASQVPSDGPDTGTPPSISGYDVIQLPTGRKRKFQASKLTPADVKRCPEPWALSGIVSWIREMTEEEQYLTRKTIEEGILNLFCAKVPTMNVADAEALSATVVEAMYAASIIIPDEDVWVKFGPGQLSGVLWQLTGSGCYAQKLHEREEEAPSLRGLPLRCYSHHCGRTVKKINLDQILAEPTGKHPAWEVYFGLTMDEIKAKPKKEVQRQNNLYEFVYGEEDYMNQLDVLRVLYRDQLRASSIIPANKLEKFIHDVFLKIDAVKEVNKEHLLAQMKYRQKEQAPWIVGYNDIVREWIRKARPIYHEFCSNYPSALWLIKKEAARNMNFRAFLEQVQQHPRSNRLDFNTYMRAPIARLQRYGLLLETELKNTLEEGENKINLLKAIEEVKAVTHECDEKVAETSKKVEMLELQSMLVLRPGFQSVLNLDHLGRELIRQGDLQRQGSKGVRWVDTHALLFDHYFILAKSVKDGRSEKKYDVSKEPIPMPLLFLESANDDPVSRQNRIAAPLTRAAPAANSSTALNKVTSNSTERPALEHSGTSTSLGSLSTTVTRLTPANEDSKIIFPFRIKHLGHDVYTLYASSEAERTAWCEAIVKAKERHARALHAQNAEPFRLRVLSDAAFAYDSATAISRQAGVSIKGTPLDRAMREMERQFGTGRGPPPVCRATVNCAVSFQAYGKSLIAIGTDFGVYISEASSPRGWTRSLQISRVTQIAILEDFNVCLLISEKSLISYPLDVVAPVSNYPTPAHDNSRRAPQRLAKDVAFFATARMKDRMLVFYKRKEGMHNTFKVIEPVVQKASEKKSRLFRKGGVSGSTESFRDYDEFYLPTECFSLNVFQTYIAVASAKGLELLTLDKKIPQSIPHNLNLPAIANIATRIQSQRPLGMFRLNDQEFLLAYEDCAVYVDKHGEVSRTLIMEYSGKQKKARGATLYGQYLVLFNEDYVEVRNAENGRLRQIIAGRDVRCIDYGFRGPTGTGQQQAVPSPAATPQPQMQAGQGQLQYQNQGQQMAGLMDWRGSVKICMSHPEVPGGQIVLEMVLNDGHAEK